MPDQSSAASEHALMQEITAPLQTLPDDPLKLVEADFPTAMRGYDRHAVDDYVEQVSRLVAELHATRSPEAAVRRALERVGEQISGILQRAHQTSEQITAQSRGEAEDRMEQARRDAAAIMDAAEQKARELDADADRIWVERQRIIADAEELAAQLLTVAREAGERFPAVEEPVGEPEPAPPAEDVLADEDVGAIAIVIEEPDAGADLDDGADEEDLEPGPGEEQDLDLGPVGEEDLDLGPAGPDPGIERTVRYRPATEAGEGPAPITDDDSTQIIPPSSDAAQHRRED